MADASHPELGQFLAGRMPDDLARIIEGFATASIALRDAIAVAPLTNMLGVSGHTNVQNEATKKLDEVANDLFCDALRLPAVARLISEELEAPLEFGDGPYTCCFDPLDGSDNIGVSSVGSVLGVYGEVAGGITEDAPITGRQLVAAAFTVYGLPSVLVLAYDGRVDGFAFDPTSGGTATGDTGTWQLAFPAMQVPGAKFTSINWTYRERWSPPVARAVDSASAGLRGRYSGSMVEDILRVLLMGGIFLYPEDSASPGGKLRMLYEVCPIGYVLEAAGGAAIEGTRSVLDVPVTQPHQRSPLIAGAADAVALYREAYLAARGG